MNAPRGILGVALALWGVSLGVPLVGIVLGIALEAARSAPPSARFATPGRLALAARACIVLAVGSLVYTAVTGRFPHALYSWLRWLPLFVLPLPIAQALAGGSLPVSAFADALRPGAGAKVGAATIDTTFAFVAVTLVAAATGGKAEQWFYYAAAAIVAWALLSRVPRARWLSGGALVLAGLTLGYGVHRGLWTLQGEIEELDFESLQEFFTPRPDPFRERTRIGDVGKKKLNDRILMRVFAEGPRPGSILLRESAFDQYGGGEWKSSARSFRAVQRDADRWILREGPPKQRITVRRSIPGGEGLLALPAGAEVLDQLPADAVETLPTGAVRAKGTPRFVSLRVAYDEAIEGGTQAADLEVPGILAPVLDQVIGEARLKHATPRETLAAIERLFAERYFYSLNLADRAGKARTLADFLLRDHKGHCEFFATGTTLLLRRAGIPARYTVGYSAQEYSALERAFVVRHRHAHAWTSAFIDGRWITVDTTPARWAEEEAEEARGMFGSLLDALSFAIDRALQWWLESSPGDLARALAAVALVTLIPAALMAGVRRWRRRLPATRASVVAGRAARAWQAIEALLARRGFAREGGETALAWARRLERDPRAPTWRGELAGLARAYYRARFDPAASPESVEEFVGIADDFRRRLRKPRSRLAPVGAD